MAIPDVPRERLFEAIDLFDRELRDSPEFRSWTDNRAYRYALSHNDRLYPVKKIVSLATGTPVSAFSGGEEANAYVQAQGFSTISLERNENSIQRGLEAVMAGYLEARGQAFNGRHEVVRVLDDLELRLRSSAPVAERPTLRVKASAGAGNWARVPWIAFLDSRETSSTQDGVYAVILFREDMSGLYLTLNQGVTVPKRDLGVSGGRDELRRRASRLGEKYRDLEAAGFSVDSAIDLRAEQGLGADYENSTIAYKLYERSHVPSDGDFLTDLSNVLHTYDMYLADKNVPVAQTIGYWIFQANPTRYDLASALAQRKEMDWLALQRAREMHVGDRVFMWESGPNAGVVGQGTITSQVSNTSFPEDELVFSRDSEKFAGVQPRVRVRIDGAVMPRLTKAEIEARPQLRDLPIITAPRMTNYRISAEQGREIELLLKGRARSEVPPARPTLEAVVPRLDLEAVAREFSLALVESNISFGSSHDRIVRSFVASLATKPLAILTGLSGSGKTQIALRFGEWLGDGRSLIVAVRPDWTGSEALFGYEDALQFVAADGRRAWHAPEVLRFMLQAARDPGWPYLLILDEMNLAHVERYFADVLSGMESRHDCLPNISQEEGYWRQRTAEPAKIAYPRNLFVVGTVNVDETTYLFSPKVLDRANAFEFRVDANDFTVNAERPTPCLAGTSDLVRGFLTISTDDQWQLRHPAADAELLAQYLRTVHRLLSEAGLEFGHRVFYEALRFATMFEATGPYDVLAALDLQIMQKVLPRIHGSRRRLEAPLCALAQFCFDLGFEPGSAESGRQPKFNPLGELGPPAKLPVSFDKIRRMVRNLRANQFTSFTE